MPQNKVRTEPYVARDGEVFVTDNLFAPCTVTWQRRKMGHLIATDDVILCDSCKRRPAKFLDHKHPYFDDFTLCKECHDELDAIDISGKNKK